MSNIVLVAVTVPVVTSSSDVFWLEAERKVNSEDTTDNLPKGGKFIRKVVTICFQNIQSWFVIFIPINIYSLLFRIIWVITVG